MQRRQTSDQGRPLRGQVPHFGRGMRYGPPFFSFLAWFLFAQLLLFSSFVVWHEGLWNKMLAADQSKISVLIVLIFVMASFYVGVRLFVCCLLLERLSQIEVGGGKSFGAALEIGEGVLSPVLAMLRAFRHAGLVDAFLAERREVFLSQDTREPSSVVTLLEIYVDRLRAPLEVLSFCGDVLIRLGLIGTIVGFILMLQSFVTGPEPSADNIQSLLIEMSGGMGTALYTTFAGLVAASLLAGQQLVLGRVTEHVIAGFIRLSGRFDHLADPSSLPLFAERGR